MIKAAILSAVSIGVGLLGVTLCLVGLQGVEVAMLMGKR
jgi:hypothetical protein